MLAALVGAALVAGVVLSSCGGKKEEAPKTSPVVAVVTQAAGAMSVRMSGHDWWVAGSAGMSLFEGDELQTGPSESASVIFTDGTKLEVFEKTSIAFISESGDPPGLEVTRGEVYMSGEKSDTGVELVTPAATARPQGTRLDLRVQPAGPSTLYVESGKVTFENDRGKEIVAGSEQSTAESGKAPTDPQKVDRPAVSTPGGYGYFVGSLADRYFRTEATRDTAENDARGTIIANPIDPWPLVNLGRARLDAGDKAEAMASFTKAIELDPKLPQAISGLAKVMLLDGKWAQASELYEEARRADHQSIEAAFGVALAALGSGNLGEAEKWFGEALGIEGEDARSWAGLGVVRLLQGDLTEAEDDFHRALSISPSLAAALRDLGVIDSLRMRLDLALEDYTRALDGNRSDYLLWDAVGLAHMRGGQLEQAEDDFAHLQEAEDTLLRAMGFQNQGAVRVMRGSAGDAVTDWEKSLDLAPARPPVLGDMGSAHLLLGENERANAALAEAVTIEPDNWHYHDELARVLWAQQAIDGALAAANKAISLDPLDWSGHLIAGLCLDAGGQSQQGRAEIERGRELAPKEGLSAADHFLLGNAFQAEEDPEKALEEYRAAASMAPKVGTYHRLIGNLLVDMKKQDEALAEFRKAVELNPADVPSRLSVATLLAARGDKQGARTELERAVEEDPDNALARRLLAERQLDEDDIRGAIETLEEAKAIPGISPQVLAGLLVVEGQVLDRQADYQAALDYYGQAIALDGTRGDAWFYYATDLEKTGRTAEARDAYQRAFDLCRSRDEWKELYKQAAEKLSQ